MTQITKNKTYLVSKTTTKQIATLIVDKNYDYSINENYNIPNISSHTATITEPMKANVLLNKTPDIQINLHSDTISVPKLNNYFCN